ncbi:MAG: hypothetical protein AB4352_09665 [Hormoscilla sp.]
MKKNASCAIAPAFYPLIVKTVYMVKRKSVWLRPFSAVAKKPGFLEKPGFLILTLR